ncbi:DUF3197 domain-containing protein [Deinococcus metallilatus]|uniref:DUF3197 domain-containing protein n=1 Tax=Deinococcus metallilatus TaxID=1211322 RepID=A0AAJ5JXF8_9DEIO|nr:DUF3197 domain-containing protein [Deinococcus metallilatus]MBB5296242.1 hypothetical protein [Deinococcus metallilatus]QBY09712.1 DUF3197 domain-containing protein [Deinococcus metallilatus]RXJ08910.1 DUF3197 domain-containing protein [Deinococcus metallilatus]TLK23711.1 DUF3197 domain-containing protein [Deinococcus metallilatus]GMA14107.1 hypothetical protein GCM10025871_04380 [Deinococcus metallilatus]
MHIAEPFGVPGAPLETLHAVLARLEDTGAADGRLILITDRQGERLQARYAALLTFGGEAEAIITAAAFGPAYGPAGAQALADLTRWTQARGWPVRETVLSASDFVRVLAEPDVDEVERLIAASNPSDPAIYTTLPKPPREEDEWA